MHVRLDHVGVMFVHVCVYYFCIAGTTATTLHGSVILCYFNAPGRHYPIKTEY